jgi:hypothetical protein
MDSRRFDALARRMAAGVTRRHVVKALLGSLVGVVGVATRPVDVKAKCTQPFADCPPCHACNAGTCEWVCGPNDACDERITPTGAPEPGACVSDCRVVKAWCDGPGDVCDERTGLCQYGQAGCGSGFACTGGTVCQRGTCICPSGTTTCGGTCCASGQTCSGGRCGSAGSGGTVLPVPTFSQKAGAWARDPLGNCGSETMASAGCFVTGLAMLFNYYQPGFTNPGDLNRQLKANDGFGSGSCLLNWGAVATVAPEGSSLRHCRTVVTSKLLDMDDELAKGHPVLAYVESPPKTYGHMVVITGKRGSTYTINDPGDGASHTWSRGAFATSKGYRLLRFYVVSPSC